MLDVSRPASPPHASPPLPVSVFIGHAEPPSRAAPAAIRQIPGTQNTREGPPGLVDEPEWMKLSTVMGLKAGGVIFRDLRA
jgi:hypothetical protein